jgi:hypothetical protein
VYGGALGAFAAAFAFLSGQLRAGHDPALGAGTPVTTIAQSRPAAPREVLVRRIIRTTVVTHVVPVPAPTARAVSPVYAGAPASGYSGGVAAAPAASAPAASAPVAAPAPAPASPAPAAPAPAPVTTRAS